MKDIIRISTLMILVVVTACGSGENKSNNSEEKPTEMVWDKQNWDQAKWK